MVFTAGTLACFVGDLYNLWFLLLARLRVFAFGTEVSDTLELDSGFRFFFLLKHAYI